MLIDSIYNLYKIFGVKKFCIFPFCKIVVNINCIIHINVLEMSFFILNIKVIGSLFALLHVLKGFEGCMAAVIPLTHSHMSVLPLTASC